VTTDHDQQHIDDIRRIVARPWWRPGYGGCGCESPRRHEPGCLWNLDPDHRIHLAMQTVVDGFPAPRLSPDRECEVLARIHADKSYARRVYDWITSKRAA
jgi:hypothetical protein